MTQPTESPAVADRPITAMRVLIADDNRDGADMLGALIQLEIGCQVDTAYDGEQALHMALSALYDVLILDLRMPRLSGLEVASQIRARAAQSKPPLLLAVTGRSDLATELAAVDARFDRAFAKPLDHATLFATLRAHWQGVASARPATEFRFLDALTRAARRVLPLLTANQQHLAFDGEGPELVLCDDELALKSDFYRLMCGALDLMGSGIVLVTARSVAKDTATQILTVHVAGSATLDAPAHTAEIVKRLGLDSKAATKASAPSLGTPLAISASAQACGVFPNSGGAVSYFSDPSEGVLLRFELNVDPVEREPPPDVDGARAWLVDGRSIEPAVLQRRLQRLGWRVSRFAAMADMAVLASNMSVDRLPSLVLVRDDALVMRSALDAVRSRMPHRTQCLLLVNPGAKALSNPGALPGWDVHVEPLSPGDLARVTLSASDTDAENDGPATLSHSLAGRPKVLVVDDIEVNRVLACAMLQILGYEVAAVADGLDAIAYCKHTPPDVVLMDVNMPVLDGITASRRIVELQKAGQVAPFAIVVATADASPETAALCFRAGAGGYLSKPLRLELMRDELRRVGVPAAA